MSVKNGFFALLLTTLSLPAFASIDPCHLEGKIVLDRDTTYTCDRSDMTLAKDLQIITNGNEVKFRALGGGIFDNGVKIDVVDGEDLQALNGKDAALVEFEAESISGTCEHIHNDGYKNGAGGAVIYKVISFHSTLKGAYKCHDLSYKGVGQGINGDVYAFANEGRIPFSVFQEQVIN